MAMLFRPLRVFLPCAVLCLLYAALKLCWDFGIAHDRNISTTAAIAMLSALQITLIGMLGEAIATRLWHMGGRRYEGVLSWPRTRASGDEARLAADRNRTKTVNQVG
jgi:hypothetical protein